MGIVSIALIVMWAVVICNGIFALVKGYFYREQEKAKKHEPNAYRKWIRISGVLLIICGVLNIIWNILDSVSKESGFKYVIFIIITVAVVVAVIAFAYARIVKPADEAAGIESEFDKILKEDKQ